MATYTYTGKIVTFTAPATGVYDLVAYGAQGGGAGGGLGAEIGGSIASQRMLPDTGVEQCDPFALRPLALCCFAAVDFGQRVCNGLCTAVEIVVAGLLGNLGEDDVDKCILIAAALTARDDVEGDLDGAL